MMKDLLISYRIAWVYGCLFSADALLNAIILSFMNVSWHQLDQTSKFLLICAVLKNWISTMLAYLSKTVANVQKGRLPVGFDPANTGNTQEFVLQQTTVKAQSSQETVKTP